MPVWIEASTVHHMELAQLNFTIRFRGPPILVLNVDGNHLRIVRSDAR